MNQEQTTKTAGQAAYEGQDFSRIPAGYPKLGPWSELGDVAKDYWNKVGQAAIDSDPEKKRLKSAVGIALTWAGDPKEMLRLMGDALSGQDRFP